MQSPVRHDGEREWLTRVVDDLRDEQLKLVYADWLEERGDERAAFLRAFVAATKTMKPTDFPESNEAWKAWAELIGFEIVRRIAEAGCPDFRETALRLARPALRMVTSDVEDDDIPVGASKLFGLPDLPAGVRWPIGDDCKAIYNDDPAGRTEPAGFCGQINLGEIAGTFAGRDLPSSGLLSFFCFQDIENDEPDVIGVRALLLSETSSLERTEPTERLIEGNETVDARGLSFEETLDLPEPYDGPWSDELSNESWEEVLSGMHELNIENMLGYGRATSGCDPTPHRQSRHLILLENPVECRLHVQIHEDDLAAANFDKITLDWVDFD